MTKTRNTIWNIFGYLTLIPPTFPYRQKTISKHKRWASLNYLFVPFSCIQSQCEEWMSKLKERDERSAIWSKLLRRAKMAKVWYRYCTYNPMSVALTTRPRLAQLYLIAHHRKPRNSCSHENVADLHRGSILYSIAVRWHRVHLFC